MAVSRLKLANPQPLVTLQYHAYQHAFMEARRLRICSNGHMWSFLASGNICQECTRQGSRAYSVLLLRAGRRGGKTRGGALAVIEELAPKNVLWWCCAPTYPKLNDYVLPAFFKQIPKVWLDHPDTDWSESELTLTLPHGAMAQFRSLEDPDRGRGPGLDGVWIDEICELSLMHWETIEPALADRGGILIATTSPKGEDWVDDTFYQPALKGDPGFWACAFTTLDNPSISPEFVARARARMTDLMFRQEYLAEVVTFTGAIFGDLVGKCVIEGTDEEMQSYFPEWPALDLSRPSITGLDPGTDHPFAGIHLVSSPRGLVAVGEYLERGQVYALHAPKIQAMRRGFTGRTGIDRSQAQAQIELASHGLHTMAADNDVMAGISRVTAWMLVNKPNEMPRGLVLPKRLVPRTIKQMQAYRYADNQTNTGETKARELVYKKNDDLCDAVRYALMTYPALPSLDPVIQPKGRDLSRLPDKVRLEIERERRSRQRDADEGLELMAEPEPVVEGMGDFAR